MMSLEKVSLDIYFVNLRREVLKLEGQNVYVTVVSQRVHPCYDLLAMLLL
jgi:hypothetical protein